MKMEKEKLAEIILMEYLKGNKGRHLTERNAIIAAMIEFANRINHDNPEDDWGF